PARGSRHRRYVQGPSPEVELANRPDPKRGEHGERGDGDEDGKAERKLYAPNIERNENSVTDEPPHRFEPLRRTDDSAEVAPDADHDHRRRENVLHVFPNAGDIDSPRPH